MPKNSSGFAFSQLIGCVLLAMTAALLLVSRSTVEMALESSILSLPQPLADGVQSIQSPTILLKWHQNLVDQRTLSNLQFSGLYDFLIDRIFILELLSQLCVTQLTKGLVAFILAIPAFLTGIISAWWQCRIDESRFGLGFLPIQYWTKNALLLGSICLIGLGVFSDFLLIDIDVLSPSELFNLCVTCGSLWAFFFGAFLMKNRYYRRT